MPSGAPTQAFLTRNRPPHWWTDFLSYLPLPLHSRRRCGVKAERVGKWMSPQLCSLLLTRTTTPPGCLLCSQLPPHVLLHTFFRKLLQPVPSPTTPDIRHLCFTLMTPYNEMPHIVGAGLSLKCAQTFLTSSGSCWAPNTCHPLYQGNQTWTRGCVWLLRTQWLQYSFPTAIIVLTALKEALRILTGSRGNKGQSVTPGVLGSRHPQMNLACSQGPT